MTGNVLIIDDEDQLRKLLTRIISLEGCAVAEAATLKTAAEVLQRQQIDVVLCDVRLPDGNGVEFVKTFRNTYPSLEIVLLPRFPLYLSHLRSCFRYAELPRRSSLRRRSLFPSLPGMLQGKWYGTRTRHIKRIY